MGDESPRSQAGDRSVADNFGGAAAVRSSEAELEANGAKVTGDILEEETELRRAERDRREKEIEDEARLQEEAEEQEKEEAAQQGSGLESPERELLDEGFFASLNRRLHGIVDKGNYYSWSPNTTNAQALNKQIQRTIMAGVLTKGWQTVYFYDNKGDIDPKLTAMAEKCIEKLSQPGRPLEGLGVQASHRPMKELEPWKSKNFISEFFNNRNNKALDKAERKEIKKDNKSISKLERGFKPSAAGQTKGDVVEATNIGGLKHDDSSLAPSPPSAPN